LFMMRNSYWIGRSVNEVCSPHQGINPTFRITEITS
jgi:hypothetical protein